MKWAPQKVRARDVIMADRGFDMQDNLPDSVELNMPPFLGGRSQLTTEEVLKNQEDSNGANSCGTSY